MRVHPSILSPKAAKWHFPAAFALLLFLLIMNIMRGPKESVVAQPALPVEKRIEVVVAREMVQAGLLLEKANLALEQRPITTLPSDAITSFDALKGKVAAGPIPGGYPLSLALLADPVAIVPVNEKAQNEVPEDPTETLLKEIEQESVAISVSFATNAPPRGSRIAVTLANPHGDSSVVIEDCWVSRNNGREGTLLIDASQALLMQSLNKSLGNLNFIVIPSDGQSPYVGQGPKTRDELMRTIQGESYAKAEPKKKNMKGYAWVPGEGVRYGIDDNGQISVVDPD